MKKCLNIRTDLAAPDRLRSAFYGASYGHPQTIQNNAGLLLKYSGHTAKLLKVHDGRIGISSIFSLILTPETYLDKHESSSHNTGDPQISTILRPTGRGERPKS